MHYLLNEHFVEILTSDKDFYQLIDIDDLVVVIKPDGEVINSDAVFNQLGVKTYQFLDYKILVGDKSDNIPGIKGIGEKTAVKLLQEYGAIAKIYENLENLKPSIKTKLESGFNQLGLLTELVAMRTDIPVDRSIVYNLTGINFQECQDNLLELNLRKEFELLSRIFPSPVWTTPPY